MRIFQNQENPALLRLEGPFTYATQFQFKEMPAKVCPARILSPGDGSPLPLTAILGSNGIWCGWLCDHPLLSALDDSYQLVPISYCHAKRYRVQWDDKPGQWDYIHLFDVDHFSGERFLFNVLLIRRPWGDKRAERVALC